MPAQDEKTLIAVAGRNSRSAGPGFRSCSDPPEQFGITRLDSQIRASKFLSNQYRHITVIVGISRRKRVQSAIIRIADLWSRAIRPQIIGHVLAHFLQPLLDLRSQVMTVLSE